MDNLYKFKAKSQVGHLKQVIQADQKLQFYSEEEGDSAQDTPKSSVQSQQIAQKSKFKSNFYVDDDSTPKNSSAKGPTRKMSKFRNLVNTQTIQGDVENEPDFSDEDTKEITNQQQDKQLQQQQEEYDIEEQAKKMQQKYSEPKKKTYQTLNKKYASQTQLSTNSDNEQVKKKSQTADVLAAHPFRHLIFGPKIDTNVFKKHLLLTQRGLIYSRKCLKGPSEKFIKSKQVVLAEAKVKKEKALILDLDETLIHSCQPREGPQIYVTAYGENGEEAKIGVNVRPYANYFLAKMSQLYTLYVYTASSSAYANAIINYLDPKKEYISGALTRLNCMETKNGFFIKDLRIISNKNLKDMLIVDNLAHSFGFQIENGIPILEWHNDQNDMELNYLVEYLSEAVKHDDLREFNKRLKLDDLIQYNIEN